MPDMSVLHKHAGGYFSIECMEFLIQL